MAASADACASKWAPYMHSLSHGVAKLTLGSAEPGNVQQRPGIATFGNAASPRRAVHRSQSSEPRMHLSGNRAQHSHAGKLVRSSSAHSSGPRRNAVLGGSHLRQSCSSLSVGSNEKTSAAVKLPRAFDISTVPALPTKRGDSLPAEAPKSACLPRSNDIAGSTVAGSSKSSAAPEALAASDYVPASAPAPAECETRCSAAQQHEHRVSTASGTSASNATGARIAAPALGDTALSDASAYAHLRSQGTAHAALQQQAHSSGHSGSAVGSPQTQTQPRPGAEQLRRLYAHWSAAMQQRSAHMQQLPASTRGRDPRGRPILTMRTGADGRAVLHARQSASMATQPAAECFWLDRLQLIACPVLEVLPHTRLCLARCLCCTGSLCR